MTVRANSFGVPGVKSGTKTGSAARLTEPARSQQQTAPIVNGILKGWKAPGKSTHVNVMLYQGPFEWTEPASNKKMDAQTAALGFPEFHVILCKTPDDSDAPNMPTVVNEGKTMICQVGQKGQSVGVIGIYKMDKGTELYYQRVVMTEEFETPADKEKGHPVLKLLQDYSDTVRDNDYLSEMAKRKKLHAVQAQHKEAGFVGDTQCYVCHKEEWTEWAKSKHSHAYDALAKIAKHPVGRNFDGECIICHTVGFDPYLGFYHQPRFGRPALALDLMEPFRPLIAESVVVQALNTKRIVSKDFVKSGKSVALTASGRKGFFQAYEARMDTLVTHPLFGYRVSYRRLLEIQTRLLAKFVEGSIGEYPVFVTR